MLVLRQSTHKLVRSIDSYNWPYNECEFSDLAFIIVVQNIIFELIGHVPLRIGVNNNNTRRVDVLVSA